MMINEFRAWLDGFKEAVGDAPTPEQWAKVLAKLGEVHEPVDLRPFLAPATPPMTLPLLPYGPVWVGDRTAPFMPSWPSVTCGGTSAGLPGWLQGATLTNMRPLDAVASAAILSDVESLYTN